MNDHLMTFNQAKKYLHVSRSSLYRYATEGKIPAIKMVGRWKFKKDQLDKWLESLANEYSEHKEERVAIHG